MRQTVVQFSICVHGRATCPENYVVAIYDHVFRSFVCNSCGTQHRFDSVSFGCACIFRVSSSPYLIASIATVASSAAVVANDNHSSDCVWWLRTYFRSFQSTLLSALAQRFQYQSLYRASRCGNVFRTSQFRPIGLSEIRPGNFTNSYWTEIHTSRVRITEVLLYIFCRMYNEVECGFENVLQTATIKGRNGFGNECRLH